MQTSTATPEDLDELEDSALLKRYVDQRCERSFALLFERWNSKLHRFIQSKIGDWDTAEELTQHTWERAFRHAHRFQWEKKFSTWIFTIADNLAKNQLRNRSRTPITLYQRIRDKWNIEEGQDRGLEWGDRSYAPDREAQKRELEDLVHQATGELKEQHRAVFVLREFEGKDYEAIAEMTGVKLGTVKSRLSRARQHFRDALLDAGLAAADLDQLEIPDVDPPTEETVDAPPSGETVDRRRAQPGTTVQWRKGYNGLSAVHAVSASDEEGRELLLACGGELPVQEREGVELNPEPEPTCQRCQWALASDEPVAA